MKRFFYGFGGISLELAENLIARNENISGFVVDKKYMTKNMAENKLKIPVISFEDFAENYERGESAITITLGEPFYRERLSEKLKVLNIEEASINLGEYISAFSRVGDGTIFNLGSIVSSNCSIGKSCLINKRAIIGHDSFVGNFSVISPAVIIGGYVSIGCNCFVGLGANIRDRVKIGNNVIIGMGANVTKDLADDVIAFGNPARMVRRNEEHKVFK